MIIYLAGNFASLSKKETEAVIANIIINNNSSYHRLVSYYFPKNCKTVIDLMKDVNSGITLHAIINKEGITNAV